MLEKGHENVDFFMKKYDFVSKPPRLQKIVKKLICEHFGKMPLKSMLKSSQNPKEKVLVGLTSPSRRYFLKGSI